MLEHLDHLYPSYGKHSETRTKCNSIGWDTKRDPGSTLFLRQSKRAENTQHLFRIKSQ